MLGRASYAKRPVRLALAWAALCSLWACSINPPVELVELSAGLPEEIGLEIPFHSQTELQCGPAALAMVLGASGIAVEPETLTPQVYLPERGGSLQIELQAATRTWGRIPFQLNTDVSELLLELAAGRPVLVLQNLGTESLPIWHYAVLTGYQRDRNRLRLNSGKKQDLWLSAPEFLRTWSWAGRWAIVTLMPGEFPEGATGAAEPTQYLGPVVDFEAVAGTAAAKPAWLAATERWPDESLPALALGNLAHEQGELKTAAYWYSRGLTHNRNDPVLANNLASVLGEAGCARAGEGVLAELAAEAGPQNPFYETIEETRRELEEQHEPDRTSCAGLLSAMNL